MKEDILGYEVTSSTLESCLNEIVERMECGRTPSWAACINPHSWAVARVDDEFREALRAADWLIPDGVGIMLASRMLRGRIRRRLTGPDLFIAVNERLNRIGGKSVFFLGASEETLAEIRRRMARQFPNLRVAGTFSPPFKPKYSAKERDEMIAVVNQAAPDVLWVGMTAPKQEKWILENLPELNVRFAGAIGAVFDFYAGRVRRSPAVFQKMGLDWLPRLLQEPRRLWRRTFVSAPIFVVHVLSEAIRRPRRGQ